MQGGSVPFYRKSFLKIEKGKKIDLQREFFLYLTNETELAETAHATLPETTLRSIFASSSLSFGVRTREL